MNRTAFTWLGRLVLLIVLAGLYAPVGMVFLYSFTASDDASLWTGFSTRWYGELFGRGDLWDGLKTSLIVGLATSTLSVVLGTLAALGLRRWHVRLRQMAGGLLALPLVVPDMILGVSLGLFFLALGTERGLTTIVLAQTVFGISYAFVVMVAAVQDFDETLYAAALDCGATPWQAFWRVVVPILAPSLVVAWLLVFALSFDDYLVTFFSKGIGNDTLPIKLYSQIRFGVKPYYNALFVLLFVATLSGVLLASWLTRRRGIIR